MHIVSILGIIFSGIVMALAIIGSVIIILIKFLKGGVSRRQQALETDETKIIQEIYIGLTKMEKRVEALETILLDRERKRNQR